MENPLVNVFIFLFERELEKLEAEIRQYTDEESLWRTSGDIINPAGNLCLHLCGNLQHYIGTNLGKTGYVRDRPREFAAKGISKKDLLTEIKTTINSVLSTLRTLDDNNIHGAYPEDVLGYPMTIVFFLNHLFGHLSYHLGQVNYHRRIIAAK